MALFLNRPVDDLLERSRVTLGLSQRAFGEALGCSGRTAERWAARQAHPSIDQVRDLARLVYPHDRALAETLAEATSETLISLGLETPPPPPPPPPIPQAILLELIVSAAAEAARVFPSAARAALSAAFTEARARGVSPDALAAALAPPDAPLPRA